MTAPKIFEEKYEKYIFRKVANFLDSICDPLANQEKCGDYVCDECPRVHVEYSLVFALRALYAFTRSADVNQALRALGFENPFLGHGGLANTLSGEDNASSYKDIVWSLRKEVCFSNDEKVSIDIARSCKSGEEGCYLVAANFHFDEVCVDCAPGCSLPLCPENNVSSLVKHFFPSRGMNTTKPYCSSCDPKALAIDEATDGLFSEVAKYMIDHFPACGDILEDLIPEQSLARAPVYHQPKQPVVSTFSGHS